MSQPSLDLLYDDTTATTYTVSEVFEAINAALRRSLDDEVWIRGEIEGLKQAPSGHVYFQLVERSEQGVCVLNVSLFAGVNTRLQPMLRKAGLRLANGMHLRVLGRVEAYPGRSTLNLRMTGLDPTYTLGQMALDRDALLRRLDAGGWLGRNKRRPLPPAPTRIGLVASWGSAGCRDFLHELEVSGLGWRVLVADTRVQGEEAAAGIVAALAALARRDVDAVALVRGGGARTDLAVFDHEDVAMAVARMPVPVLTGVGHEVDTSVADHAAHTALKTPTACAAHLVEQVERFLADTGRVWAQIERRAGDRLAAAEQRVDAARRRAGRAAAATVTRAEQRLDRSAGRLVRHGALAVRHAERDLAAHTARLGRAAPRALALAEARLTAAAARADAIDPVRALARGWTITRTADGRVVRTADDVAIGDVLQTLTAAGTIASRVEEVRP